MLGVLSRPIFNGRMTRNADFVRGRWGFHASLAAGTSLAPWKRVVGRGTPPAPCGRAHASGLFVRLRTARPPAAAEAATFRAAEFLTAPRQLRAASLSRRS